MIEILFYEKIVLSAHIDNHLPEASWPCPAGKCLDWLPVVL
jgi:hypothetical protein